MAVVEQPVQDGCGNNDVAKHLSPPNAAILTCQPTSSFIVAVCLAGTRQTASRLNEMIRQDRYTRAHGDRFCL